MKICGDYYIYSADDEEPKCGRCDNYDESEGRFCIKHCGPEHGWYGYQRSEPIDI